MPAKSYFPHINGLRALAILGIVLYHLNADYCPAGYFGVDLFLVISGYFLFRKLMAPETPAGFRYGDFLMGKAWRILPSWFVLIAIVSLATGCFMYGNTCMEALRTARNSVFFSADFYIDHLGDYFNPASQENPFLHLWYLSITIQLYIIAPLLTVLIAKLFSRRVALCFLIALGAASLLYYIGTMAGSPLPPTLQQSLLEATGSRNSYYHLLPRFWEFLAGYAVLLLPAWEERPKLGLALAALGMAGLVLPCYLFETGSPVVYITVFSAMLVIRYGGNGVIGRFLSLKPVQWLGGISFSLYLWHWPVMAMYKYVREGQIGIGDEALMLLVSLLLGLAAWKWVESGLRRPKAAEGATPAKRKAATALTYGMLLTLPLGFLAADLTYRSSRKSENASMRRYIEQHHLRQPDNAGDPIVEREGFLRDAALLKGFPTAEFRYEPVYLGNAGAPVRFLLMGDSHAQHLYEGVNRQAAGLPLRGIALNNFIRPFHFCHTDGETKGDATWNEKQAQLLFEYIAARPETDYIIISLFWKKRLFAHSGLDWRTMREIEKGHHEAFMKDGLRETCKRLTGMGKKVVLLAETPSFDKPSPLADWKRHICRFGTEPAMRSIPLTLHAEQTENSRTFLDSLVAEGAAHAVIDPAAPLFHNGKCDFIQQGEIIFADEDHLTIYGSELVGAYLLQQLQQLMVQDKNPGANE